MVDQAILKRAAGAAFTVFMPLAFLAWLARPTSSVIYVTRDPFTLSSNTLPAQLPQFFEELLAYYRGTSVSAALALAVAIVVRRAFSSKLGQRPSLIWFVPTLVSGLEAVRHVRAVGTRHSWTHSMTIHELRVDWAVAGMASLSAVLLCIFVGIAAANISRSQRTVPAFSFAVPLSVAALWVGLLGIAFGPW